MVIHHASSSGFAKCFLRTIRTQYAATKPTRCPACSSKDLIKVFVDESEWSKIEPCYMETTFLSLLRIKRETAEKFLEDLRRISQYRSLTCTPPAVSHY